MQTASLIFTFPNLTKQLYQFAHILLKSHRDIKIDLLWLWRRIATQPKTSLSHERVKRPLLNLSRLRTSPMKMSIICMYVRVYDVLMPKRMSWTLHLDAHGLEAMPIHLSLTRFIYSNWMRPIHNRDTGASIFAFLLFDLVKWCSTFTLSYCVIYIDIMTLYI